MSSCTSIVQLWVQRVRVHVLGSAFVTSVYMIDSIQVCL
jgi:hypothetical protein